ncbi:MAG: sialate O-acetylesterase [Opitutaceae bacterium]
MRRFIITLLTFCLLSCICHAADQALKLAGIFGDQMVLQQNTDAAIWGQGTAGETVKITSSWNRRSVVEAKVDGDGKWRTRIRTPKAGGPFQIEVMSGDEAIQLQNVLSGEVWICSGQSNMQWKLRGFGVDHFKEEVQKAKYPQIRFCAVPQVLALEPQEDVKAKWSTCNPQTALNFSAVAYFFGSRLHQELDVPIGLISTNWGGSSVEAWTSSEVLEKELSDYVGKTKNYTKWHEESGLTYTKKELPKGLNQRSPTVLYNHMIQPLIPFSFRGVIWYQGESNVDEPVAYRSLFPAMINDWRARWGQGDFPFYYVQIAPFAYKQNKIPAAFLREAQTMALSVPNTGMISTMDIGEVNDIHPKPKKPVGERLARLALARDYGRTDLVDSGPHYKVHRVERSQIRLGFESVGGGLTTSDGGELTDFTIAGKDQVFHPATAAIDGITVLVRSDEVPNPVAVRFGWGNADSTNFTNKEGLPAPSFRTDDWPIKR